ncbi:MAG: hypothetical protein V3T17_05330 [Pseudomonadales bacterium]
MSTNTADKIKLAIVRIEKGRTKVIATNRKLSITSVAEEAGIHRTTIINRHPVWAEVIRQKSGAANVQKDDNKRKIAELEQRLLRANKEIKTLKCQLEKAVSIQAKNILK